MKQYIRLETSLSFSLSVLKSNLFYIFLLLCFLNTVSQPVHAQANLPGREKDEKNEFDRPDLAAEQLERLTKDPKLGHAPRERLKEVWKVIRKQHLDKATQSDSSSQGGQGSQQPNGPLAPDMATWVERGPNNVGGRTRAIMFDPNDGTHKKVWVGGVDGGLWFTNDITAASPVWQNVNDFWANLAISTIAYDPSPSHSQIFYAGTGEGWFNVDAAQGAGIWKTTDGGTTWNQLSSTNNSNFYYVQKVVVHPVSGDVYASTRNNGVMRSQDGGTSWTQVLGSGNGASASRAADLEIGADNTLYASMGIFQTDGIYSSTSGNAGSWTKLNTGANGFPTSGFSRIEIGVAPSDANRLYAMVQSSSTNGLLNIYTSVNKGSSWTTCILPTWKDDDCFTNYTDMTRTQAWYDLIIAVDPNNASNLLVGGVDVMKSTTAGTTTWKQITSWWGGCSRPYVHADQHAIAFQPGSSAVAVFGNDGGVFYSGNITATSPTFTTKDNGYNVTQFYSCAIHPTSGTNYFLAGAQDNGTQQFTTSGINTTTDVIGGDGAYCFIDQTNATYQIGSYVYNNYYLTTNNWASATQISTDNTGTGDFINPADYDDANHILYSAYSSNQLQRISGINSTPSSPVQINVSGMTALATNIRVSPYSPGGTTTLFVGTDDGKLYKVTNAQGSPTTTNISGSGSPWSAGSISCIEIGASESDLLVTFSNYGVVSVWRTTNGGSTWSNKEGNLPDMPVWWAMYNPNNLSQVFLATEVGVWSTSDITVASPGWSVNNNNLANVRVTMFQLRSSDKQVIAATHGRGLFSTGFFQAVQPVADFSASPTTVCAGRTVTFTDLSTNSPTSWQWTFTGGTPASSSLQNPTVTYNTGGSSYTVALTASNSAGSNTNTKTNYITVTTLPTINAGGPTTFCSGGSVTLTASSGPGYLWSTGATTQSINVNTTGRDSVTENGCSSLATVVTVNPIPTITPGGPTTFCSGGSVTLAASAGANYLWSTGATSQSINVTASGSYSVTESGCISSPVTVTVKNLSTSSQSATACASYIWNGVTYTTSGVKVYHTTNAVGCDSAASLNLTIKNSSTSSSGQTACYSYVWNGSTYTTSGAKTYHTINAAGCDSLATLNLTISVSSSGSQSTTACFSYAWNGATYTSNGDRTHLFVGGNAGGCDSLATLHLTINVSSSGSQSTTACSTYLWNGTTYTSSGDKTYLFAGGNAGGCDSLATLHLTIRNSSSSSTNQTACYSYVWNGATYTTSGIKTYHTTNSVGCDSAASLNLTINSSSTSNLVATTCDSYVWNGTTYTSSGSYTYHTINAAGCDSAGTLTLTVNSCYIFEVKGDSVASCTDFYFTIWLSARNGTISYRSSQYTLWISNAFVNGTVAATGGVTYVTGTSDISATNIFGNPNFGTPSAGGVPPGTGGDTSLIKINTSAIACPGYTLTTTPVRLGQFKVTRSGTGCWNCAPEKLGFYIGNTTGNKVTSNLSAWTTCPANTILPVTSGTYLNNKLNNQTPVTTQPVAGFACVGAGSAQFSIIATNTNPGSPAITYQWLENGIALSNNPTYSGVTASALTITNPPANLNGNNYSCRVTQCGSVTTNTASLTITGACVATLNLKIYLQGYYQNTASTTPMDNFGLGGCLFASGISANPAEVDTVIVSLMDPVSQSLAYSNKGVLKTNGLLSVTFPGSVVGHSYYIRIRHRNSIETWSANAIIMNSTTTYDFTSSEDQAYGSNMIKVDHVASQDIYAFFSGDVYDATNGIPYFQDGVIESGDYGLIEADYQSFLFGYYGTDVTGDGVVESADYSLIETNYQSFIFKAAPW